MREVKAAHIVLPQDIKDQLNWDKRFNPEELVQLFTLVETIPEMEKHILENYNNDVHDTSIAWHISSQALYKLKSGKKPISNNIAPYFNRYRLPPQHEYIKY